MINKLIGGRYATIHEIEKELETLFASKNVLIFYSESDRLPHLDFMLDCEIDEEAFVIYYIKDNGGNMYITEIN